MTRATVPARRRRTPAFAASLAGALCALLAACASIPTAGPVTRGDVELNDSNPLFLQVYGPSDGATPEQIVRGFLSAQAGGANEGYETARMFLTGQGRLDWDPYVEAAVYSGDLGLTVASAEAADIPDGADAEATDAPAVDLATASEVVLTGAASLVATVDEQGRYTEAASAHVRDVAFSLRRDATGQWRIDAVADGLLVSQPNFQSVFRATPVYFATPDGTTLVPDLRWFPQRNIATYAVRALLAGPSAWLRDAVVSGAPAGTSLAVEAVTVDSAGTAKVDLAGPALSTTPAQRALLLAQMEATLRGAGASTVDLTAAGAALTVADPVQLVRDPDPGNAVGVQGGALVRLDGRALVPVADASAVAADVTALATDGSGTVVARDGRERLVRLTPAPAELVAGADLASPSIDVHGWVWTADAGSPGRMVAVGTRTGARVDVVADWAVDEVVAVRLSRDGARAVVLSRGADGTRLDVAGVVRDADGTPQMLSAPVQVGASVPGVSDVTWVDELTLAVIGEGTAGGAPVPTAPLVSLVPLGARSEVLSPVDGAQALTAGRGSRALWVRTSAGDLLTRSATGTNWSLVAPDVQAFAFAG